MDKQLPRTVMIAAFALLGTTMACASGGAGTIPIGAGPRPTIDGSNQGPGAGPSVHEVAQTTTLTGSSTGPATATCPQGEVALGGGWSVPAQNARVFKALLTSKTWAVYVTTPGPVRNPGAAALDAFIQPHPTVVPPPRQGITVTAYVECLAGSPGAVVTQRANTVDMGPTPATRLDTQLGGLAGFCAQNEAIVGSGFDLGGANANLELEGDWPRDDITFAGTGWVFSVRNYDTMDHPFTYYVECLSNASAAPSHPRQDGNPAYASMTTSAVASCPSGAAVAGGGFQYERNSPGNQYLGNAYLLHATSAGWQSDMYVESGYGLYYVTSLAAAVCLSFS